MHTSMPQLNCALQVWLRHWPRERLLVLRAEDYFSDSQTTVERVIQFLGLRPLDDASKTQACFGVLGVMMMGHESAVLCRVGCVFVAT